MSLVRQEQALAWELRGYWIKQSVVVAVLTERCLMRKLVGRVSRVSVTGATCEIDGWHIPVVDILTVRKANVSEVEEHLRELKRRREERIGDAERV